MLGAGSLAALWLQHDLDLLAVSSQASPPRPLLPSSIVPCLAGAHPSSPGGLTSCLGVHPHPGGSQVSWG